MTLKSELPPCTVIPSRIQLTAFSSFWRKHIWGNSILDFSWLSFESLTFNCTIPSNFVKWLPGNPTNKWDQWMVKASCAVLTSSLKICHLTGIIRTKLKMTKLSSGTVLAEEKMCAVVGPGKKLQSEFEVPKSKDPGAWLGFFLKPNELTRCGKQWKTWAWLTKNSNAVNVILRGNTHLLPFYLPSL